MYTLKVNNPDKLFFTSDTHLSHYNICRYCHRPFESRAEMDKTLIQNWNSVVPEDGIVIHCGDLMLPHNEDRKEYNRYVNNLNGKILLLRGNHDRIPLSVEDDGKFIAVVDMAIVEVEGIKIFAQHYPALAFNGDYQVFGHIHTLKDGTCHGIDGPVAKLLKWNQYDVGVDQNDYKPISYWELCDIFKQKRTKL